MATSWLCLRLIVAMLGLAFCVGLLGALAYALWAAWGMTALIEDAAPRGLARAFFCGGACMAGIYAAVGLTKVLKMASDAEDGE